MKKERSPHNYKKTHIDIFCDILVKIILPCIVIGIMLLITFSSKASSVNNNYNLPYYVDYYQNAYFSNTFTPITNYTADSDSFYWVTERPNLENYPTIAVFKGSISNMRILGFYNYDKTQTVDPEDFNFNTDFVKVSFTSNVRYDRYYYNGSWVYWSGGSGSLSVENQYFLGRSSENMTSLGYTNLVPFLLGSDITYNGTIIFTNGVPEFDTPIEIGHATPPDEFNSPVYTTGHTPPSNVPPTLTVNNYSWTTYTPPTIDNSTLEKLLESLTNIVKYNANYLKDNLHNEFTNLINNIKNLIDYIGQTIQYYGDLIIENIQNLITTFYNNMLSLFEPISIAIDYISQPLDMDSLTDVVNSTQIFSDVGTCTTFANDAFGIYGTVAEPNTFKIPLDLRSISLLNITQVYYIDLSWLDGAKSAIRAFMWCVVTFGLLYSVIVDIPNMIKSSK